MKFIKSIAILFCTSIVTGCVQKSSNKTIVLKLDVKGIKNIQSVGIRGNDKPLSWDYDMELKPVIKDTLYTATFSLVTGYKFTEAKFTVNGQYELNNQENRKIFFSDKDTTIYQAKFDVAH